MRHRKTIILTIEDHFGDSWDVVEIRDTKHDFPVYLGYPAGKIPGRDGCPMRPTAILSKELAAHLGSHRRSNFADTDLPIGASTLKRFRKLVGFNRYDDARAWWEERIVDLGDLTLEAFAAKHGVKAGAVEWMRLELLGKTNRDNGWWRAEPARAALTSDRPASEIAKELEISEGAVGRLRVHLKREGFEVPTDYRERIGRAMRGKPAHPNTKETLLRFAKRKKPKAHRKAISAALRKRHEVISQASKEPEMPRPKSDLAIMSIKLGEADRAALERLAEVNRTNMNEMIRVLIRAEVKRQDRREAKQN